MTIALLGLMPAFILLSDGLAFAYAHNRILDPEEPRVKIEEADEEEPELRGVA